MLVEHGTQFSEIDMGRPLAEVMARAYPAMPELLTTTYEEVRRGTVLFAQGLIKTLTDLVTYSRFVELINMEEGGEISVNALCKGCEVSLVTAGVLLSILEKPIPVNGQGPTGEKPIRQAIITDPNGGGACPLDHFGNLYKNPDGSSLECLPKGTRVDIYGRTSCETLEGQSYDRCQQIMEGSNFGLLGIDPKSVENPRFLDPLEINTSFEDVQPDVSPSGDWTCEWQTGADRAYLKDRQAFIAANGGNLDAARRAWQREVETRWGLVPGSCSSEETNPVNERVITIARSRIGTCGDRYYANHCTYFVSQVLRDAEAPLSPGVYIWDPWVMAQWFISKGRWQWNGPGADPQPGNVVIWIWPGGSHGAFVDGVDEEGNLYTIDGNGDDCVRPYKIPDFRTNPHIIGYGDR